MAKITGISNGEAGSSARTKINTAMASVETDSTLTGDGNVGTPLSVDASQLNAASIKTVYESNLDTNAFTDAEKTKLTGIETGATADQTGAEIKAAYEAEANTNAYTDAEKTKLGNISITQPVDLDDVESDVADLRTLSGTADGSVTLGTFTGTTISDNTTVKAALQEIENAVEGSVTVHSDITSAGSGSIITTAERDYVSRSSSFATFTDPLANAATGVSTVDSNVGVIITTTAASNDQTLATPTDPSRKSFLVGVSGSSTHPVQVNTTNVQVGQVVEFVWDGAQWINDPTQNSLLASQSTGWISGCDITINANTTSYDVSAGVVCVVDSHTDASKPVLTVVPFAGVTAKTPTNLATAPITAIAIDSAGAIVESNNGFVGEAIRDYAVIGSVGHPNLTNVTVVNSFTTTPNINLASSLNDLGEVLGTINESGNIVSANGANLNLNLSAGSIFRFGANAKDNLKLPNTVSGGALTAFSWFYTWEDGVGGYNLSNPTNVVTPSVYDDGTGGVGVPNGTVSNNQWTIQRVYVERSSNTYAIQYGTALYSNPADAQASLKSEPFSANPSLRGFVLRSWLIVKGNATDLSDPAQAIFINAGKFGDESASGATTATTTLQSAYNNSATNPEIQTNTTNGPLSFRTYSGGDATNAVEVQNNAGTVNFAVTGEGNVSLAGTVDGRDIAADGTTLDNLNASGLSALTTAEVDQLENIDTVTISNAQWGYLGATNQGLATTDNVTFADLIVSGDLTVNGTTTTINSTTLTVDDKNIEIGSVAAPSDVTADGGGITLKGATDKTIIWDNANDNWTSNQNWNLSTGLDYKINNVSVLNATTLGSSVVNSSLTSVGTLSSLDVSGDFTVDTNVFHVDSTNNRIGIGTATPEYGIDVRNSGTASGLHVSVDGADSGMYLTSVGASNAYTSSGSLFNGTLWEAKATTSAIWGANNGRFSVFTDTGLTAGNTFTVSERFIVTPTGEASFGRSVPSSGIVLTLDAGTGNNTNLAFSENEVDKWYIRNLTGSDALSIYDTTAGLERVRIDSNGNVGIGGDIPSLPLHVLKGADVDSTVGIQNANTAFVVGANKTTGANRFVGSVSGSAFLGTTSNHGIEFATNNSVRAYLDNAGNLGIGTTTPSVKLTVAGSVDVGFIDSNNLGRILYGNTNGIEINSFIGGAYNDVSLCTGGGNVGVGTNSPFGKFEVRTNTNRRLAVFDNASGPTLVAVNDLGASVQTRLAGQTIVFTGDGGAGATHMTLESSGNLGIGASGASRLFVNDSTNATVATIQSGVAGSFIRLIDSTNSAVYVGQNAGTLKLQTNAVDRLTINTSGIINYAACPTYADDAAAGTGGLVAGDIYKTSTGELRIKL